MSIELPEATVLTAQMNKELLKKTIKKYLLKDYERMQKIGFLNKDIDDFTNLVGGTIDSVITRGNTIIIRLPNNGMNLLYAPEYGGKLLYHTNKNSLPEKFHLKLDFKDDTFLTIRITSMGVIMALSNKKLTQSFMYQRDFKSGLNPNEKEEFTFKKFSGMLESKKRMLKSVLVGKDAIIVGISNSAFQEILYKAGLYPKKRASDLNEDEKHRLYDAIKEIIKNRIQKGGKSAFMDLYGKKGRYKPLMGSHMKNKQCSECGTSIEKLNIGGGSVYLCPLCQK